MCVVSHLSLQMRAPKWKTRDVYNSTHSPYGFKLRNVINTPTDTNRQGGHIQPVISRFNAFPFEELYLLRNIFSELCRVYALYSLREFRSEHIFKTEMALANIPHPMLLSRLNRIRQYPKYAHRVVSKFHFEGHTYLIGRKSTMCDISLTKGYGWEVPTGWILV